MTGTANAQRKHTRLQCEVMMVMSAGLHYATLARGVLADETMASDLPRLCDLCLPIRPELERQSNPSHEQHAATVEQVALK